MGRLLLGIKGAPLNHEVRDHCSKDITGKPKPEGGEASCLKNQPGKSTAA